MGSNRDSRLGLLCDALVHWDWVDRNAEAIGHHVDEVDAPSSAARAVVVILDAVTGGKRRDGGSSHAGAGAWCSCGDATTR